MLQLFEVDPLVAALAFADGSGFNANHNHLPGTTNVRIEPVSPTTHVTNVVNFQRMFRPDLTIVACASCGMTILDDNDSATITLLSKQGAVFRVLESHALFAKYSNILAGEFPTDIQFFTVHLHLEPGKPVTFYHLHSDLLVDAPGSTFVNDKLVRLCNECFTACRKKLPKLPFFNPGNSYDFGKIPCVPGSGVPQYPFNLTLAEQIVCAKCISQQTHIKFNATEEIGVQGHVVCFTLMKIIFI